MAGTRTKKQIETDIQSIQHSIDGFSKKKKVALHNLRIELGYIQKFKEELESKIKNVADNIIDKKSDNLGATAEILTILLPFMKNKLETIDPDTNSIALKKIRPVLEQKIANIMKAPITTLEELKTEVIDKFIPDLERKIKSHYLLKVKNARHSIQKCEDLLTELKKLTPAATPATSVAQTLYSEAKADVKRTEHEKRKADREADRKMLSQAGQKIGGKK
jgi:hypothetical protein